VLGHTLSKRILTGIAIEQRFLVFGFGQQLVRMLAVDLDQQLAQLAKLESGTAVPLIKPRERPSR
jgi:hypothetical protein